MDLAFELFDLSTAKSLTTTPLKALGPSARVCGNLDARGRLLLVGTHPDDLCLSMGSLAFAGFEQVFAVMFTRGTTQNPRASAAIAEAIALGADCLFVGDAPDATGSELSQDNIVRVWRILTRLLPSVVVTHLRDGDPHPAHTRVSEVVTRAIWRMPLHARPRLLYAQPPANYHERSFTPDIHVALNDRLALLLAAAIDLHPSECTKDFYYPSHKLSSMATQAANMDRHGLAGEFNFVESFMTAK